jgi:hypothetical protein
MHAVSLINEGRDRALEIHSKTIKAAFNINVTRKRIYFNFDLNPFIHKSKQVTTLGSELLQNTALKFRWHRP